MGTTTGKIWLKKTHYPLDICTNATIGIFRSWICPNWISMDCFDWACMINFLPDRYATYDDFRTTESVLTWVKTTFCSTFVQYPPFLDVVAHLIFYYRKMRYNNEWHMHMKRTKAVIRRICNNMRKSKMEIIIGIQKWAKADEATTRYVH